MANQQNQLWDDQMTTRQENEPSHQEQEEKDRTLQEETENIFIRIHNRPRDTNPPTSAPTPIPLVRDFNYRSCVGGGGDDGETQSLDGVADIHFVYDVETTGPLTTEEEKTMLNALETAMIESIFNSECRRRLGTSKRRLEIHSISSGNQDKLQGECVVTTDDATVCSRYDGSVKVGYIQMGDNSTELKAGNAVLKVVSTEMNQDGYLDAMNFALEGESPDGNTTQAGNSTMVTRVSYVGTSFYNINGDPVVSGLTASSWAVEPEGSLTTLGKIFVPVMVLLFIGTLVAMYLGYNSRKRRQRLARLAVLRAKDDNVYQRNKQERYRDPFDEDVKDLALRSCNQDVHKCNMTNCVACMQQLPTSLKQISATRTVEDYSHPKVEVVDPDNDCQSDSVVSALTGPYFGGWNQFGRKSKQLQKQPVIQVEESVDDSLDQIMDKFYDEPPSVKFVRVDSMPLSEEEEGGEFDVPISTISAPTSVLDGVGVQRKIIDHTGQVRSELEL